MSCPKVMHPDPAHLSPRAKCRSRRSSPSESRTDSDFHATPKPLQNMENMSQGEILAAPVTTAMRREFSVMHDLMNTMMARTADQHIWFVSEFSQMKALQLRMLGEDSTSSAVDGPRKDKSKAVESDELRKEVQELRAEIGKLRKYLQEDLKQQFQKQDTEQQFQKPNICLARCEEEAGQLNSSAKQTEKVDTLNSASKDGIRPERSRIAIKNTLTDVADHLSQENLYTDLNPDSISSDQDTWKLVHSYEADSQYTWFELAYQRKLFAKSGPQALLQLIGISDALGGDTRPENFLVKIVCSSPFQTAGWLAVMFHTCFITYQLETVTQALLSSDKPFEEPAWMKWTDRGFMIFFAVEALLKLLAYRIWFFTSPTQWKWNSFDLFIVVVSVSSSIDVVFLKTLRVMRVLRQLRSFKSLRLLRVVGGWGGLAELRRLVKSVESCMASLFWSILFLGMVIYFFSIFILAGIVGHAETLQQDASLRQQMGKRFGGIIKCCKALLTVIGGPEWADDYESLNQVDWISAIVVPVYLLFVQIGILNIVVGVFAEAATASSRERDLVAQDQISEVEDFVGDMMSLFKSWLPDGKTKLQWEEFKEYMYKEEVQAYLSAHDVDTSHAQVLFHICDHDKTGSVDMHLFVLGLLRLRGAAKSLDAKIMVHSLSALESSLVLIQQLISQPDLVSGQTHETV